MSIKTRLMLALLAFAVIPIIFVGTMGLMNARKELMQARIAELESIADLKKKRIERFFHERKGDITALKYYTAVKRDLPILEGLAGDSLHSQCLSVRKMRKTLDSKQPV